MNERSSNQSAATAPDEISLSCRGPLVMLFLHAAFWLVAASVLALVASLKFHSPAFLSGCAWLTYGRVHSAAVNAQLYGFAVQAGLGVALWIIAQTGRSPLPHPLGFIIGAAVWNLGVLSGIVAILAGQGTGYENLEFPFYSALLLFLGFLVVGSGALLAIHSRRERSLTPAHWFLIAALFWFPWILSGAYLLLTVWPVRGLMQSMVVWWFGGNLTFVWLSLVGLAALFHFIPQILGRPLHSRQMALFTFWTLLFFGSWTGIPSTAPVPAWIPALSAVMTLLTLVTLLSAWTNLRQTNSGGQPLPGNLAPLRFLLFGLGMFQLAGLMRIVLSLPVLGHITSFTWFAAAQIQLQSFGFFSMVMLGAVYFIFPRLMGTGLSCTKAPLRHFWLAAVGCLLVALPWALGGVAQGLKLADASIPFMVISHSTLSFLRVSSLGEVLILVCNLMFAMNLLMTTTRCASTFFLPAFLAITAQTPKAEVKP